MYFTDVHPTGIGPQRQPGMFSASAPMAGYPKIYNIEMDPHEDLQVAALFGWSAAIPGDMLWYTSAYALIGAWLIVLAGRPLVRRTMQQQHYEANFRFGLIHVRRNAEQIALARATPTEDLSLRGAFGNIRQNFVRLVYAQLGVRAVQDLYGRIGEVLPLFLMLPKYFAEKLTFGQVMSGRDAFSRMLAQLSFFSQAYPSIAEQVAKEFPDRAPSQHKMLARMLDPFVVPNLSYNASETETRRGKAA